MKFSLIISTRGRVEELRVLFRSLLEQTLRDFEIIIADQNEDERLAGVMVEFQGRLPLRRVKSSGGLSRGRNEGIALASGEIFGFPDDDCAYPPRILEEVAAFFESRPEFGFLSGRSFADDGADSVSCHAKHASEIRRGSIHRQCIEFAVFIRRRELGDLRFDENMGVGALSPWQSDEGPDLLLRLKGRGARGFYDPRFGVWHPRPITTCNEKDIDRTYRYACGNGYFYRKHRYSSWYFAAQMLRTTCGLLLALATFRMGRIRLYRARLLGRMRGWNHPQGS